ncbi:nuclear transport factor 2 family protein [Rhodococcus sp. USK13]|uniref:nuclear transport factor 2 family protein n=1 Tax=Rhodococcus sp. USK13 TaxID=2806442 RepID=UPI001BCFA2B2|nr:nuclear transport factor 2 family protein [Rhodococcus sp. USK13]
MTDRSTLAALAARLDVLESEAEIRRIQSRYMFLCDTPCPEFAVRDDADRVDAVLDLYTDDAIWEGVGDYYADQFGAVQGTAALRAHFERFWGTRTNPRLVLNAHYLTSEQIHVDGDNASGQWIHMQPWLFADGTGVLRSSRLNNRFRRDDGIWRVSRTRTENVFVATLPTNFADSYARTTVLMDE